MPASKGIDNNTNNNSNNNLFEASCVAIKCFSLQQSGAQAFDRTCASGVVNGGVAILGYSPGTSDIRDTSNMEMRSVPVAKRRRLRGKQNDPAPATVATPAPIKRKAKDMAADTVQRVDADGHILFITGGIVWCNLCGRYGETRTHDLRAQCKLVPGPGSHFRLKRLQQGRHPTTNVPLRLSARRLPIEAGLGATSLRPLPYGGMAAN